MQTSIKQVPGLFVDLYLEGLESSVMGILLSVGPHPPFTAVFSSLDLTNPLVVSPHFLFKEKKKMQDVRHQLNKCSVENEAEQCHAET